MKETLDRVLAAWLFVVLTGLTLAVFVSNRWPLMGAQVAISTMGVTIAIRIAMGRMKFVPNWLQIPLAALPIWSCLQIAFGSTIYPFATWSSALLYGMYASVFFVAIHGIRKTRIQSWFLSGSAGFGFLLASEAILQRFTADGRIFWVLKTDVTGSAMGPFVNYDHFSAMMELLMPVALWRAISDRRHSAFYLVAGAVMFAAIVTSASKAGFALGVVELLVFLIIALKRGRPVWVIGIGIVFLLFAAIVGWDPLMSRYTTLAWNDRLQFYRSGLAMLRERPWLGFGSGTWQWAYPGRALSDPGGLLDHAHNDWLEWSTEGGLIFSVLLGIYFVGVAQSIPRSPWVLGAYAVVLHSLVDFPLQEPAIFIFLIVLTAISVNPNPGSSVGAQRLH